MGDQQRIVNLLAMKLLVVLLLLSSLLPLPAAAAMALPRAGGRYSSDQYPLQAYDLAKSEGYCDCRFDPMLFNTVFYDPDHCKDKTGTE